MVTYLDKEAVLKAVKDAFSNPEHIVGLLMRIERGEFDATLNESALVSSCLADKDSEIARLNYLIAGYHEAIAVLRESKDQEIAQQDLKLKDLTGRIKALDGWKRTNATYGSPGWSATASAFNEGIDRAIEVMHGNVPMSPESGNVILGSEPAKDEPELFICPKSEGCEYESCPHKKPHEHTGSNCEFSGNNCKSCIPYKKEPTVPQEQQEKTCKTCKHPTCPQRTTSSNAYQICVPLGDFVDREPEETRGRPTSTVQAGA